MRVIIAGGRDIKDASLIRKAVDLSGFKITEVVSGHCKDGIDKFGEAWAKKAGIDLTMMPANWEKYKRPAGPIRNERMAIYASSDKSRRGGLIAIWDGKSTGTKSMIDLAHRYNLKVFIYRVDQQ